ncbi:hypothetical protein EDD17DRAFT_1521603 [Pisolithus thermaeus]|nr:hypothetical protein EDD17DRAFT_1521603 [Pisolithus thermaeus]
MLRCTGMRISLLLVGSTSHLCGISTATLYGRDRTTPTQPRRISLHSSVNPLVAPPTTQTSESDQTFMLRWLS